MKVCVFVAMIGLGYGGFCLYFLSYSVVEEVGVEPPGWFAQFLFFGILNYRGIWEFVKCLKLRNRPRIILAQWAKLLILPENVSDLLCRKAIIFSLLHNLKHSKSPNNRQKWIPAFAPMTAWSRFSTEQVRSLF